MNLIIGMGEVGSSLAAVLQEKVELETMDVKRIAVGKCEILHICYPYLAAESIEAYAGDIKRYRPLATVIHSTVFPGTTDAVSMKVDEAVVAHSPVMGKHPYLARDLKTYTKFIACRNRAGRFMLAKFFESVGIDVVQLEDPRVTEVGKLLSTTRYGLVIAFAQMTQKLLAGFDPPLGYDQVVTQFIGAYNEGLRETDRGYLSQPSVIPGPIGGHCVMQNIEKLWGLAAQVPGGNRMRDLLEVVQLSNQEELEATR